MILFGAIVRITGSGAGCGQHWPTCQGEVAHIPRTIETVIEFTHRITSGVLGLVVFGLTGAAFRLLRRGHAARKWLVFASIFLIVEALIGRALVRLALVGDDASVGRAVIMPLHLVNTSLLLGTLALAAFCCWPRDAEGRGRDPRGAVLVGLGLFAVLVVSASGALTALGDTVYPTRPSVAFARIAADPGIGVHFLERLRVFHPVLAVAVVLAMFRLLPHASQAGTFAAKRLARLVVILLVAQVVLGAINILLSAPGWMQVAHLMVACLLWMGLVVLAAELWSPREASSLGALLGGQQGQGRASGSSFEGPVTSTRSMR